jgi:sugar lactone lactonase YvrE
MIARNLSTLNRYIVVSFLIHCPLFAAGPPVSGQKAQFALGESLSENQVIGECQGVAVDPVSGKLFVADRLHNRVLRFSVAEKVKSAGRAEAVLGQADFVGKTAASGADRLSSPWGLHVDASGRLWVADSGNNRVLRFDNAASKVTGAAADRVLGQANFTANSGGVSQTVMNGPTGVWASGTYLWVADRINDRVLRYDNAATLANGAASSGVLGQTSFSGSSSGNTSARFNNPYGLCVDGNGRLWVADSTNNRLLRFDAPEMLADGAAAAAVLGQTNFTAKIANTTADGLNRPVNVTPVGGSDPTALWVADYDNNRVVRVDNLLTASGKVTASQVLGQLNFTSAGGDTYTTTVQPRHAAIAVDTDGLRLFTAGGSQPGRVLNWAGAAAKGNGGAYDTALGALDALGSNGITARSLGSTQGAAVDPLTGKVFIADSGRHRVLRFASEATLASGAAAEAVLGQTDFAGSAASAVPAANSFNTPLGLTFSADGKLFVVDSLNNRVMRYDSAATLANGTAASAVFGQDFFTSKGTATLSGPTSAAIVGNDLYTNTPNGNRLIKFTGAVTASAGSIVQAGESAISGKAHVAMFADGTNLWLLNQTDKRVDRISVAGAFNNTTASTFTKTLGAGSFDFASPTIASSLALSGGRLYATANTQHRVVWWDGAASLADGTAPTGSLGLSGQSGLSFNHMDAPAGLAVMASGSLLVADSGNKRVLFFTTPVAPPRIIAVGLNPSGRFFLTFESVDQQAYEIQASEPLTGFTKVADITANATTTTWTDSASAAGRKFFRVVIP